MLTVPVASSGDLVAIPLALLIIFVVARWLAGEKVCQFCGYEKNNFKSTHPVCQQCGRNRRTGGAGPNYE